MQSIGGLEGVGEGEVERERKERNKEGREIEKWRRPRMSLIGQRER